MKKFFVIIFISWTFIAFGQKEIPYFQQKVDYDIKVTLDDEKHELTAFETINYTNNSPKTLQYIYFHLWPNAYKNYKTALAKQLLEEGNTSLYYAEDSVLGYIDGIEFKTYDIPLQWEYHSEYEDVCVVYLTEPLLSGESIEITTPFKVKLPIGYFSRLGHIGQSYQITQWYPKPAVYDNNGWHDMPYLNQGEFYSEYGTFDVHITLPKNYVVGATGDLVNGEKELQWLNKLSEKTVQIDSFDTDDLEFPASSNLTKTLHYHQEKVHDFAWFADKRYHVLKGEVELPHSKEKVTTWAMFTNNEAHLWKNSIEYLNDAIYYYSLWNGDYPYKQVTAVDGSLSAGAGMEYPNVTVIGESTSDFGLETVIMHEIGHNWFYGILGSNERVHPWMDEGLNTTNEIRYIENKYPNQLLFGNDSIVIHSPLKTFDLTQYKHKASYELIYLANASRNLDQPIEYKAKNYGSLNYGGIVYGKTGLVFSYLRAYLGDELFDQCMHHYFNEWKFKHPQPENLRTIFEEETGKNLDWFFEDLIKTTKKIDYKIVKAKKDTANPDSVLIKIKIKNKGVNGPFSISGVTKDGNIITTQWYEPIDKKAFVSFPKGDFYKYRIDAELNIPEIKRKNNNLQTKGIFKKTEPLRIQLLGSIENPDKTQLFFTPIAGWNMNDKGMIGLALYNSVFPFKRFEYVITPLYAPNSKNINGYANVFYHIHPKSVFSDISIGANSSSFSYLRFNTDQNPTGREILEYYKINPKIEFTLKKRYARQFTQLYATVENVSIYEEKANYSFNPILGKNSYAIDIENFYVNRLIFGIASHHPINPYGANVTIEQSEDFVKLNLTANYFFAYKKKGTGLNFRVFIGNFLYNNSASNRFEYSLSGNSDYTYDHILFARNTLNTFLNQQMIYNDGGFKNLTTTRTGDRWIRAVNIESNLFTPFLSVYGDFGITGYSEKDFNGNEIDEASKPTYNLGVALNIIPNRFEIYFPVFMSSDLNQLKYNEKVRFMLDIRFNPFKFARNYNF